MATKPSSATDCNNLLTRTLPFAVVVTPGTLSVESRPHYHLLKSTTSYLDLERPGWTQYYPSSPSQANQGDSSTYITAEQNISALAFSAAMSSKIIPSKPEFANETFSMTFPGPYLQCADANSSMQEDTNAFARYNNLSFLSWVGDAPWPNIGNVSYTNTSLQVYAFQLSIPAVHVEKSDRREVNNTLWISLTYDYHNPLVKECKLWNADYDIELIYENFEQNMIVHNLSLLRPITTVSGPNATEIFRGLTDRTSKATLAAFAALFVGIFPGLSTRFGGESTQDGSGGLFSGYSIESRSIQFQKSNVDLLGIFPWTVQNLDQGIEELFQNLTLSLFSLPGYLINSTDVTTKTVTAWSNTFIYQQQDLLLAYGISALASLICCVLGLHSFYRNGSSFQNNFSTYVRAAGGSNFDIRTIVTGDTGADPLPKRIGKQEVIMASRKNR